MDPPPPATAEPFYRNRGTSLVRLHRRPNQGLSVMYAGVYCCQIPDRNGVTQTLCVGAYIIESAGNCLLSVSRHTVNVCVLILHRQSSSLPMGDELRICWFMERKVICYQLEFGK